MHKVKAHSIYGNTESEGKKTQTDYKTLILSHKQNMLISSMRRLKDTQDKYLASVIYIYV